MDLSWIVKFVQCSLAVLRPPWLVLEVGRKPSNGERALPRPFIKETELGGMSADPKRNSKSVGVSGWYLPGVGAGQFGQAVSREANTIPLIGGAPAPPATSPTDKKANTRRLITSLIGAISIALPGGRAARANDQTPSRLGCSLRAGASPPGLATPTFLGRFAFRKNSLIRLIRRLFLNN